MLHRLLPCLLAGCLYATSGLAQPTEGPVEQLLRSAQAQDLHLSPAWLTLGHYHAGIAGGFESQADDPAFFLSDRGKHDPAAELKATLGAILAPGEGDQHARCRFPARDAWLREQLGLPRPDIECPALDNWMAELNTETVTLVFAASYLNSPSSMFGHTFLRLDPPQQAGETNLLLADTISYAADAAAHDSEILFAYRGIFGGYPGITSIRPYYEMVKLYSDIENRDLWEYRLNLTEAETRQLLRHTWEVQGKRFDYYFFDENCAYRLLALIDAARPGTRLLDEVFTHAIPSDTVRWVMDRDLVADINYRPSASTVVRATLDQLTPAGQEAVAGLAAGNLEADDPALLSFTPRERVRIYDAAYGYVRYQARSEDWPRERAAPLSHELLVARSRLDAPSTLVPPGRPAVRDDQGHDTFRASIRAGRSHDRNFVGLTLRPSYHDVLDPPAGYRDGAQLQFLRLDARFYLDNEEWQLERFTGVEIRSLSPVGRFFTPLSWQVGFGARRTDIANGKRVLTPYLEGGAGYLTAIGNWQLGVMGAADLEVDSDLDKGWAFAPGADLLALRQGERISLLAGVKSKWWMPGNKDREDRLYAQGQLHFGKDHGLSVRVSRTRTYDRYDTEWAIGWHAYF